MGPHMDRNIALELLEETQDFANASALVDVPGMSTPKVCALLNGLVARMDPEETYLEIGTWKGLTLLSAARGNVGRRCVGCDHFRFWGKFTGPGVLARTAFYRNLRAYRSGSAQIEFHPIRAERMFAEQRVRGPIGVYFYDGDHSYEATRQNIVRARDLLSARSILVVDDWNDVIVREATQAGIAAAGLHALWHRALPGERRGNDFWNGVGLFYLERCAA